MSKLSNLIATVLFASSLSACAIAPAAAEEKNAPPAPPAATCVPPNDTVERATKIATEAGWEVLGVERVNGVDYFVYQRPEVGKLGSVITNDCVDGVSGGTLLGEYVASIHA